MAYRAKPRPSWALVRTRASEPTFEEAILRPSFRRPWERTREATTAVAQLGIAIALWSVAESRADSIWAAALAVAFLFHATTLIAVLRWPQFEVTGQVLRVRGLCGRREIPWSAVNWPRSNMVPRTLEVEHHGGKRQFSIRDLSRRDAARFYVLLDRFARVGDLEEIFA